MKVKIGPFKYKLTFVDSTEEVPHDDESDSELYGQVSYPDQSIRVCTAFSAERVRSTVIHEIIHAIIQEYSLVDGFDELGGQKEDFVIGLANGLAQALQSMGVEIPVK